jgi:hypothetical protein
MIATSFSNEPFPSPRDCSVQANLWLVVSGGVGGDGSPMSLQEDNFNTAGINSVASKACPFIAVLPIGFRGELAELQRALLQDDWKDLHSSNKA